MSNFDFNSPEEFVEKFKKIADQSEWNIKHGSKIRGKNNCCPLTFYVDQINPKPAGDVGEVIFGKYGVLGMKSEFESVNIIMDSADFARTKYFNQEIRNSLLQACNLPSE